MRPFYPTVKKIAGLTDVEPLGSGGMAEVYRARRKAKKGGFVAVKVLKDAATLGPVSDYAERFERECRTAIALKHPHLVAAYETGVIDERPYLVMEYIDGLSADRRVRLEGPLPVDEALAIFAQVAEAVAYMHREGYVHSDIKPSNVLLAAGGVAKLSDFGLAKTGDDPSITLAGGVMGTPHYLAPEQISGPHMVDRRADIYSLGATLYFLVVGEPPFKGATVPLVLTRQLTDAIRFPESWTTPRHQRLIEMIERMTAKSPNDRPQSMDDVLAELAWVKKGKAVSPARRRGAGPIARRRKKTTPPTPAKNVYADVMLPDESRRLLRLAAGRVLFYEDDIADAVFWLLRGRMEVLRGGRRVAVIADTKKVLGEMAIVKGTLRSATLRALTDSLVLRVGAEELTGFLAKNPRMIQSILADMAERIDRTSTRLLEAELQLDDLRKALDQVAARLENGKGKPGEVAMLLRSLAVAEEITGLN